MFNHINTFFYTLLLLDQFLLWFYYKFLFCIIIFEFSFVAGLPTINLLLPLCQIIGIGYNILFASKLNMLVNIIYITM